MHWSEKTPSSNNTREDSTHGHHQMVNTKISSVQFSHSVVSDSLWPHESQHARPPCPSPSPGVHSDYVHWVGNAIQPSHPLSSPFPAPIPSQHQSLFQRQFFPWGGQSTGCFAEKLYTVSKNKTGSWLWLGSWTPYCQIQTDIEKVEKTTRPFRYDLNQIPNIQWKWQIDSRD